MAKEEPTNLAGDTIIHRGISPEDFSIINSLDTATAKLVYLHLTIVEEATPYELKHDLGIDLLTLYPILEQLRAMEIFEQDGAYYRCTSAIN